MLVLLLLSACASPFAPPWPEGATRTAADEPALFALVGAERAWVQPLAPAGRHLVVGAEWTSIADVGAGWWGKLYEEHGRAVLAGDQRDEHVKAEDWNTYEILAVGDRIQTAINGAPCVDLVDPDGARRGIVAFQVHSGGAVEIRYRILGLELDPAPDLSTVSR